MQTDFKELLENKQKPIGLKYAINKDIQKIIFTGFKVDPAYTSRV